MPSAGRPCGHVVASADLAGRRLTAKMLPQGPAVVPCWAPRPPVAKADRLPAPLKRAQARCDDLSARLGAL
jgi:hypothetical protein